MAEAHIDEQLVPIVSEDSTGEEQVSAKATARSVGPSVRKRVRASGQYSAGSIGGKKRSSGSFRTGLPKRGEEQEMSFRCIDEADRLVDYLRAKAVTLKAEGENSQKMIEENDKKLKRAEEERAALLREMERDRKLVAIFAGDRMKAEEFKYESVEMLNRLHQLLLLKGQQKPIEEVFAIVNSTMDMFVDDNAKIEAVHEPMKTTTETVTVKEEPASSDDDCRSNDSQSTVLLPRKPFVTASKARKPAASDHGEEGMKNEGA